MTTWWMSVGLVSGGLTPGSLQGTEHFVMEVPSVTIWRSLPLDGLFSTKMVFPVSCLA